jgi:hypothetical protein
MACDARVALLTTGCFSTPLSLTVVSKRSQSSRSGAQLRLRAVRDESLEAAQTGRSAAEFFLADKRPIVLFDGVCNMCVALPCSSEPHLSPVFCRPLALLRQRV